MIKAFFFDLDGTLVETHHANFLAYQRALANYGIRIDFEAFKQTIGRQFKNFMPELAPTLKPQDYEKLSELKTIYYKEVLHSSKLNERLVSFLYHMSKDHLIVLVTTAKRVNAEAVLTHHGLLNAFNYTITAQDVAESKPSPEAYLLALQKTQLQPNEVIAFEDSDSGQQSAEAAGIAVVRVSDFSL